jgi:hypothetical protein
MPSDPIVKLKIQDQEEPEDKAEEWMGNSKVNREIQKQHAIRLDLLERVHP